MSPREFELIRDFRAEQLRQRAPRRARWLFVGAAAFAVVVLTAAQQVRDALAAEAALRAHAAQQQRTIAAQGKAIADLETKLSPVVWIVEAATRREAINKLEVIEAEALRARAELYFADRGGQQ